MSLNVLAYRPGTAPICRYSTSCGSPSTALPARLRRALATASRPAHCGVDRLVPPALTQLTAELPGDITAVYWPVSGSALKATSATPRRSRAPTPGRPLAW